MHVCIPETLVSSYDSVASMYGHCSLLVCAFIFYQHPTSTVGVRIHVLYGITKNRVVVIELYLYGTSIIFVLC